MKHFTSVHDLVPPPGGTLSTAIDSLVQRALVHKANPAAARSTGAGKRVGCLFLNPSMRTRLSTQIAAQNLGMEAIVFNVAAKAGPLNLRKKRS